MEEMLPDETADQFEERMRTKRSNILLKYMGTQLEENGHINFTTLIRNNKRKLVCSCRFFFFIFVIILFLFQLGCTKVLCASSAQEANGD